VVLLCRDPAEGGQDPALSFEAKHKIGQQPVSVFILQPAVA